LIFLIIFKNLLTNKSCTQSARSYTHIIAFMICIDGLAKPSLLMINYGEIFDK